VLPSKDCHPRESGDPVPRGFSVNRRRLWDTGSPGQAGRWQPTAFSRHDFVRAIRIRCPSEIRGRRESRAPTAPAAPCAMG